MDDQFLAQAWHNFLFKMILAQKMIEGLRMSLTIV